MKFSYPDAVRNGRKPAAGVFQVRRCPRSEPSYVDSARFSFFAAEPGKNVMLAWIAGRSRYLIFGPLERGDAARGGKGMPQWTPRRRHSPDRRLPPAVPSAGGPCSRAPRGWPWPWARCSGGPARGAAAADHAGRQHAAGYPVRHRRVHRRGRDRERRRWQRDHAVAAGALGVHHRTGSTGPRPRPTRRTCAMR